MKQNRLLASIFVLVALCCSPHAQAQTLVLHYIDGSTEDIKLTESTSITFFSGSIAVDNVYYDESDISRISYKPNALRGDLNGDGAVDVGDIMSVINIMAVGSQPVANTTCPDANHPHWIDLGLPSGTQLRCCNEGASTPEEYGGYYTFDEARSYNPPSHNQIRELFSYCTSVWTTQNGVNGCKFTGPNGGTIFLPAAGGRWNGELDYVGSHGDYWSSTPDDEDYALSLGFSSGDAYWGYFFYYRTYGLSVRPVR